ncbi:MAG: glycosyltransferase [Rhodothermales bacterium]|nr:glycosyltransferase [Rhodothermales bacterium]
MTGSANDQKRVLVLSYYFPPLGMSGVQRITKFVKYLPDFGWQPSVISSRPYSYFAFDGSLTNDIPDDISVTRTRSLDPTRWRLKPGTVTIPSSGRHGTLRSISNRFFVPDNKILWVPFARNAAIRAMRAERFDMIFSTAPPYSSHMLAVELGDRFKVPVVTDFRDNWVGNPRTVFASDRQRLKHERLERKVLEMSNHVVTINSHIREDLVARSSLPDRRFSVIEQGYDAQDFKGLAHEKKTEDVTFLYSGVFYDAQKPDAFLHGLARARNADTSVSKHTRAVFVGLVPENFSVLVEELKLGDVVRHTGYMDHDQALAMLMQSDIPWLTVGHQRGEEQISTGKLAEYVGTRKPILGLVPDGAASRLLHEYGDSVVVDPDDIEAIAGAIVSLTNRCRANGGGKPNEQLIQRLERKRLTGELAQVFNNAWIQRSE